MDLFCRSCLNKYDEMNQTKHNTDKIRRLYEYCSGIQIEPDDGFPLQLCNSCTNKLTDSCRFKKQCRKSNRALKTFLGQRHNDTALDPATFFQKYLNPSERKNARSPGAPNNGTAALAEVVGVKNEEDLLIDGDSDMIISNFMSEILHENDTSLELSDCEAEIIREMIKEEVDLLQVDSMQIDSVESSLLQDDTLGSEMNERDASKSQNHDKTLICDLCCEAFPSVKKVEYHKRCHSASSPHECLICKCFFKARHRLLTHQQRAHGENIVRRRIRKKRKFTQVMSVPSSPQASSTPMREDINDTHQIIDEHFPLNCDVNGTHNSPQDKDDMIFVCKKCNTIYNNRMMFLDHLKKCRRPKRKLCTICGKEFTDPHHMKKHKLRDAREEQPLIYICGKCKREFSNHKDFNIHIKSHSVRDNTEKPSGMQPINKTNCICKVCGLICSKKNYAVHLKRHNQDFNCFCDVCKKGFLRKADLERHLRVHTGIKPFGCTICDKRFTRSDKLTRHMRIHSGERPFQCNICSFRYSQSNDLVKHKKTHAKENDASLHNEPPDDNFLIPSDPKHFLLY